MINALLNRFTRLRLALAGVLAAGIGISAAGVTTYVSGQHSLKKLVFVAVAFFVIGAVAATILALIRYRRLAFVVAWVCVAAEAAAVRAVIRFHQDFDEVVPRPLVEKQPAAAQVREEIKVAKLESKAPVEHPDSALPAGRPEEPAKILTPKQPFADLLKTTRFDFPQFLGPNRRTFTNSVTLDRNWTAKPPSLVWRQPVGAGWSAFSVVNGYAVTLEQKGDDETVVCYRVATGKPIWTYSIKARYENPKWRESGIGPRSTPTIENGKVYSLSATGRLLCLNGVDGKLLWGKDLPKEFGMTPEQDLEAIPFGHANSPLVEGDLVVVPIGGPKNGRLVSLAAFNKRTGEKVWESGTRHLSQSSPSSAMLAGVNQILIVNENTISGHDAATGQVLWEQAWSGITRGPTNVSQAMPAPPNRFFVSRGYGDGAALYEIVPAAADGLFSTKEIWKSNRVMRTRFTNVAIKDGYVYGLSDGILECIDLETGERVWKQGRYGHGQILLVGESLLVMTESGEIVLVDASPGGSGQVFGRFQALEGICWNNIALYGPFLLVRNASEAACYRLPLSEEPR